MNGASADPCAKTRSAPTSTITTMIGSIQNFLRARMNAQISLPRLELLKDLSVVMR